MKANEKYSYNIRVECSLDGTPVTVSNDIRLQDQFYHYLSNADAANEANAQQAQWGVLILIYSYHVH